MPLEMRRADASHIGAVEAIYEEAFPPEERIPFETILRTASEGTAELIVFETSGDIAGFAYSIVWQDLAYLFFFAMNPSMRGKGNGSEALSMLLGRYENKRVFLVIEPPDESSDNAEQRRRRHAFYLRNGLHDLPFQVTEEEMTYDAMGTAPVSAEDYEGIMSFWCGGDERVMASTSYISIGPSDESASEG